MLRCTPARLLFAVAALVVAALPHVVGSASEASDFPLRGLEAGKLYSVTVSVDSLYRLSGAGEIEASISDGRGPVASKILHAGDLDLYITLRARVSGGGAVRLNRRSGAKGVPVSVECRPIALEGKTSAVIAALPNGSWQEAQEFELGQTIFGTADERAFIPAPSEDAYQALVKGFQWFKVTYRGTSPKLAYFMPD